MRADDAAATVVVVDGDVEMASWRMDTATPVDLSAVDTLARLQLVARRAGLSIRLRNPSARLLELVALVGLTDLLPLQTGWKAECGEQLGVEEVVEPGNPVA